MRPFAEHYARAAARKGGAAALEGLIPASLDAAALGRIPDDRWLSELVKSVFRAGFVWRVVEARWPAFERALDGFDPHAVAYLSDDDLDRLLANPELIRHHAKMRAARDNALFMLDLAQEHGSAARFFADWPERDYVGLLEVLKRRASRMGGTSAQYFLRRMGKPSFVLTDDVVRALVADGVVARKPTSKRDRRAVQDAFNAWADESGRDLTAISRVLAMSVD
ncbi:MAG: DNA-3-methyladenine glycosylase I [Gammaproteobacteria bacterium]